MMGNVHPRMAEALLQACLSREDAEIIAGDLEETFRTEVLPRVGTRAARRWYWQQVISVVLSRRRNRRAEADGFHAKRATMASARQDFSYALRTLRKQPAFTFVAVLMLALGIGANVAIFSLCHAVLFKPLPFTDPDRLMLAHMLAPDREAKGVWRRIVWSYPKYAVFRDSQNVFESTAVYGDAEWNLTGTGSPERLAGEFVESTYFHVLGVSAQVGRTFTTDETRAPGSAPLAILGHVLWMTRFGGDPGVLGRSVGLNGVAHTIVGVLPPGFRGLSGQGDRCHRERASCRFAIC
jgi:hypothetical protein